MTRRRAIWAGAGLIVIALLIAVLAAAHRSPYAFLEQYNPEHVRIDLGRITGPSKAPKTTGTMLVFRN
ncbi:MAG TPA: hypothetical protein VMI31_17690, partial [Fimbriimonadaceae bacterium]|nr:hypothetical protein [Fimbriimonadaceae bacterium]